MRLAVLAGGRSSEHEISLACAASVVAALDPERYDVRTIEIGRDGRWALPAGDRRAELAPTTTAETLPVPADSAPATLGAVDVVLPILHGPFGEDGTVQGLCELAGVAYVGPGCSHRRCAWTRTCSRRSCAARDPSRATSRSGSATR